MNPADCPHDEAHWLPTSIEGVWERVCDRCGLSTYGVSLSEARRIFEQKAEQLKAIVTTRRGLPPSVP